MSDRPDYRDTVFLPKTDFPMKADLVKREPERLKIWDNEATVWQSTRHREIRSAG